VKHGKTGAALLEVIVALTILGTAGMALVAQLRQSLDVVQRVERSERELVEASAMLDAIALWPRDDLDRHLGSRRNGPWRLEVLRPSEDLYEIRVRDSTDTSTLVATTLYRASDDGEE
jgi:hypothetical protein